MFKSRIRCGRVEIREFCDLNSFPGAEGTAELATRFSLLVTRDSRLETYSYLNASIGSNLLARRAG